MRALIQRVAQAWVEVEGKEVSRIGRGLLIFLGIRTGDTREGARWLARKAASLRVFEDEAGKMNLALPQVKGKILVVSQFTLYGDCRHGNRPGFTSAAAPGEAGPLYQEFVDLLRQDGLEVQTGVFGARMRVFLENEGPVTLWLETPGKGEA